MNGKFNEQKLSGRVYTPQIIVKKILDDIGYTDKSCLGKTVLEPSCGDGAFLRELNLRIENWDWTLNRKQIDEHLNCIYAWDINERNIDYIKQYIPAINATKTNAFKQKRKETKTFDYIVGNPPWIRIQNLGLEEREYIQKNYEFCKKGSTDTFIAFFELCESLLSENGKCGLITPNSYFSSKTAKYLRQHFKYHKNLLQITNYGDIQLFDNVTTYSAITIFNKKENHFFTYQKAFLKDEKLHYESKPTSFDELTEPFWQLSTKPKSNFRFGQLKLKDICDIHCGIQTLFDKGYIFKFDDEQVLGGYYQNKTIMEVETKLKGKIEIERNILKDILKISKYDKDKKYRKILFPYIRTNNSTQIIPEFLMQQDYPLAYKYLLSIKDELDKRDKGKPNFVAWYAYGRNLGLNQNQIDMGFGERIIFSPINKEPKFHLISNPHCLFYSGYYMTLKPTFQNTSNYQKLLILLNSLEMKEYIEISSRDFKNGWKSYNKEIIENFPIENFEMTILKNS